MTKEMQLMEAGEALCAAIGKMVDASDLYPDDVAEAVRKWTVVSANSPAAKAGGVAPALTECNRIEQSCTQHEWVPMPWQEAYPASDGRKCVKCGQTDLAWLG